MNDLLIILRKNGLGCHVDSLFVGAIMFADDLALLAPTRGAMQKMLDLCESYCREYCLSFNAKKTKSMIFGKGFDTLDPANLMLNNERIQYVSEWRYLGCLITRGKEFSYSCRSELASFRRSANSIVSSLAKPSEQVAMKLLYSFSVPILTYASEVKQFTYHDMHDCNVALNDAIRRIFSYNRWESIRTLRQQLGYRDLYTTFASRRQIFLHRITRLRNQVILSLFTKI